ncbi:MAG: hypothetical protein JWN35_2101, partial [Frankiales bacterium]|nr:hypothetical protein [Frankiales bacterium]
MTGTSSAARTRRTAVTWTALAALAAATWAVLGAPAPAAAAT